MIYVRWLPWQMIIIAMWLGMPMQLQWKYFHSFFSSFNSNKIECSTITCRYSCLHANARKKWVREEKKTAARKFRVKIFEYLTINMRKKTFLKLCVVLAKWREFEFWTRTCPMTHTQVYTVAGLCTFRIGLDWSVAWFSEGANNLLDNCQLAADCSILTVVRFWAAGVSYHTAII